MSEFVTWGSVESAQHIAVPGPSDDKYSRGVLGVVTGSDLYPGAAVLGVDAALHTGVGMVRYLGAERVSGLVLQRRPEAVTVDGRVQAWLIGSGTDAAVQEPRAATALAQALPVVLDGGALERVRDVVGPAVITPHHGELARIMEVERHEVSADPVTWARLAAERFRVTVLLKGHLTVVVGPGSRFVVSGAPAWLATAGAGDALGGILGALVATQGEAIAADERSLARIAATAAHVHALAAAHASAGGPFTITRLIEALPSVIAELVSLRRTG